MIADRTGSQRDIILSLGVKDAKGVLDVGCGDGEKTFYAARHVEHAIGIDPDENMIKAAKTAYARDNLLFQVGRAETMDFPSSSFDAVLFNESLHHIPVEEQFTALMKARAVLAPGGRLLITEPIYGRGTFEEIATLYNDEQESRRSAAAAIEAAINTGFDIAATKEIPIEYAFEGFDDFYHHTFVVRQFGKWQETCRQAITNIFSRCDRTPQGDVILDYAAAVWLLIKI